MLYVGVVNEKFKFTSRGEIREKKSEVKTSFVQLLAFACQLFGNVNVERYFVGDTLIELM